MTDFYILPIQSKQHTDRHDGRNVAVVVGEVLGGESRSGRRRTPSIHFLRQTIDKF